MIQPAAPSLLSATPARASPQLAIVGAAFALPPTGGDETTLLAGSPAGSEEARQDGAAPGNPLPIVSAPTLDPGTQTLTPVAPPPPAPAETIALPASTPAEARSPKFEWPISLPPSSQRPMEAQLVDHPVEEDATLDPRDETAHSDRPDTMAGALPRPYPVITPMIAPAIDTPPISPRAAPATEAHALPLGPTIAATSVPDRSPPLAVGHRPSEQRAAASPEQTVAGIAATATSINERSSPLATERRSPEQRAAATSKQALAGIAATTPSGPSIVPASALATSSLTPLDARAVAGAPSAMPIGIDGGTPVIVPASALDSFPTPTRRPPADTAVQPVAREIAASPRSSAEQATTSSPAIPSPPMIAGIASGRGDAALPPLASPMTLSQVATASAPSVRPNGQVSSLPPMVSADDPDRRQSSSSTVATVPPALSQAALPSHWQWAPRAAVIPQAAPTSPGAGGSPAPSVLSAPAQSPSAQSPFAQSPSVQSATALVDRSIVPTLPSTAPPADATFVPTAPAEKRADAVPIVPPPISATPIAPAAPAAIVFGAARFAVQIADDREKPAAPLGLAALSAPQAIERPAGVVSPAQAPLDMRQEHWPHAMIERIEMIRDAADSVDTRIRLVPDALGAIDVEVKRDGDTLNVRFHAEQAQTRTLLADAAPRLAEAAEARGLRLAQSSVGAGVGGGDAGSSGQGQPRQPLPATPPRAPVSSVADAERTDDDIRLA